MFEALVEGLALIFQWHVLAYFVLGCVLGILMGAVPGMGGAIGLVLLLPFTFSMEPVAAFALLLASWASTSTSGAITSVLLGVPSTAASQATVLDGYPMAKRGEAARALGASFTVVRHWRCMWCRRARHFASNNSSGNSGIRISRAIHAGHVGTGNGRIALRSVR